MAFKEHMREIRNKHKKAISMASGIELEVMHQQLSTTERENSIYKLTKLRKEKSRDLSQVKCIKDEAR